MDTPADKIATDERRQDDRVYAELPVRFGLRSLDRNGVVGHVSEAGVHIVTNDVYKVGMRIRLVIELGDYAVEHEGEVVWAIRVPDHLAASLVHGMGVRFLDPAADWSRRFRRWKAALG